MSKINDIYSGDTKVYKFDFGKGIDITNWQVILTFKDAPDDSTSILEVSDTAGDNVLDDTYNGIMYVTMSSVESATLEAGTTLSLAFKRVIIGSNPLDVKTLLIDNVDILQSNAVSTI